MARRQLTPREVTRAVQLLRMTTTMVDCTFNEPDTELCSTVHDGKPNVPRQQWCAHCEAAAFLAHIGVAL